MKAPYAIELIQVDNGGFYVKAGCKTLVYTSLEQMTNDLRLYFTDPRETIERLSAAHGWPLATGAGLAQDLGYSSATPQLKYPGGQGARAETEEPREMRPPPNEGRDRP